MLRRKIESRDATWTSRDRFYPFVQQGLHRFAERSQRIALPADVGIDQEVVVSVDRAVVVEIPVEVREGSSVQADMRVDLKLIVAVDGTVEVGIAGVRVF